MASGKFVANGLRIALITVILFGLLSKLDNPTEKPSLEAVLEQINSYLTPDGMRAEILSTEGDAIRIRLNRPPIISMRALKTAEIAIRKAIAETTPALVKVEVEAVVV